MASRPDLIVVLTLVFCVGAIVTSYHAATHPGESVQINQASVSQALIR